MAEAHQAIGVFDEHKRGVELLYSEDGIRVSFVIPPPHEIRRSVVREFFHLQRAVKRGVYPAPPYAVILTVVVISVIVVASPTESWWRSGPVSQVVWHVAWTAFLGLLLLMAVQRLFLRLLLSYRGWLYLAPRQKSRTVMAWAALLKIFGGRNPLTYSFQDALPRLPLPPLKDTIQRYLKSVHPLLAPDEYEEVVQMANEFVRKEGPKLQFYLYLKSWWSSNYVTDWWEKYVYLKGRSSLMINSNYYALPGSNLNFSLTKKPLALAATLVHEFLLFKQDLDREQLAPLLIRGIVPLCMSQYQRIFSCTRIPGRETDSLKLYHHKSKHIAVFCHGHVFKMPLFEKGQYGKLLTKFEIQRQFEWIESTALAMDPPSKSEEHLAALTAVGRIEWAKNREQFFSGGVNKRSLEMIESAIFVVVLQDDVAKDWTSMGKNLIHGNGGNRWFDKSFNLVIYKNSVAGFNAEHAWADAPVMAHVWEQVYTKQCYTMPYDDNGDASVLSERERVSNLPPCRVLTWDFSTGLHSAVLKSLEEAKEAISDFDLKVISHTNYGKGLIKKFRVSPDAFIQMALQLAYYRNSGTITQTYESSMTRLYRDGRTETVRPVTDESKAFVHGMVDPNVSDAEKLRLLQQACDVHQESYRNAMSGKGIDRHLFTLYCVSVGFGIESPFLNNALGRPWRLSTSQQPQQQTDNWRLVEKALNGTQYSIEDARCPGGGFGPVAEDGYGVSYMVAGEYMLGFHISSKKSCPSTSSDKFAEDIEKALADLKALWHPTE
ncbi:choline carnitine o [Plasmopara halstedii]|uniref:carnitine O-palmitoyltransferase n=1 Tax=Plasmopara halstedii TaxID=4781 RepID=A0A0P1AUU9_PLAHL|nr:choline carnitine o [Plasmopara halstedii]CEG45495.1 choline carnitine o [Plasmopara halstedii]|eukprot:XP_024581864.1 choline carnitine o [Plasmopara halstedii]